MNKGFVLFQDFDNALQNIVKHYVGKVNQRAYVEIAQEVSDYINNNDLDIWGGCVVEPGRIVIDTESAGKYEFADIHIKWKEDKRSRSGHGYNVEAIDIGYHIPDEWKGLYLPDIKQNATYEMAKKNRARLISEIKALEQEIAEKRKAISNLEDVMRCEAYDKRMLMKDMEEV